MHKKSVAELEVENQVLRAKYEELSARFRELLETTTGRPPARATAPSQEDKIAGLTFKQHAVLLAFFAGLSYAEIAGLMQLDQSTVKLHLKAVLNNLGLSTKEQLALTYGSTVNSIGDSEYMQKYGIPKKWWDSKDSKVWNLITHRRAGLPPPNKASVTPIASPLKKKLPTRRSKGENH